MHSVFVLYCKILDGVPCEGWKFGSKWGYNVWGMKFINSTITRSRKSYHAHEVIQLFRRKHFCHTPEVIQLFRGRHVFLHWPPIGISSPTSRRRRGRRGDPASHSGRRGMGYSISPPVRSLAAIQGLVVRGGLFLHFYRTLAFQSNASAST